MIPLTREQILNAEHEELDILVAVHVMGWRVFDSSILTFITDSGKYITRELTSYGSFMPSEDISSAWTVVEKMGEKDCWMTIHYGPDEQAGGEPTYFVEVVNPCLPDVCADTAPLAICRAALLAKLEEAE